MDAYLAPLYGCLSPFIWCVPVTFGAATVIYTLGTGIAGAAGEAAEPLQLILGRGPTAKVPAPALETRSSSAALKWWVRRLDRLLSVVTDPAVFSNKQGQYQPTSICTLS